MNGRGGDRRHSEERGNICFAFFSMYLTTLYVAVTGSTSYSNSRHLFRETSCKQSQLGAQFFLSIFINLYMFKAMCPSSGETTVFMRHLVLVILKQVDNLKLQGCMS
jgi:hypothetical protein